MKNAKNATAEEATCMMRIMQSHARFVVLTPKDGGNWKNTTVMITASMLVKMVAELWLIRILRRR